RLPRFLRRTLRVLLRGLLVLAVLLVGAWFFRQQLIAPLLRPHFEARIAEMLGARRVSIGAMEGDWLGRLDVKDIVVEGAEPPLRLVRGLRLEVSYSLLALLGGDLAGLHLAKVTAAEVELDLRAPASGQSPPGQPIDPGSYAPWLRLLPAGANVHVEAMHVLTSHGERRGPLDVSLLAGSGERRLAASYAGLGVEVHAQVPGPAAGPLPILVSCDAEDPGALLDLFGLGGGVRGGTMHAEFGICLEPFSLEARVDLADLVHRGERLAKSRVTARLDRKTLAIERASLDLPGVAVDLHELLLPSPLVTGGVDLRDLAGRFVVRIDDLAPHAAMLPEALQQLLPIRGRLAGSATGGKLHLEASELYARGAHLQIESGSMPVVSDSWSAAEGEVRFSLSLTQFTTSLPWLGATTVSGRIDADAAGSLAEPRLEARLELGECRTERGSFVNAQGLVKADAMAVAVEGLRVQQLVTEALATKAPTSVALDASCRLRAGAVDRDSLVAKLDLGSLVPSELLARVFVEHGLGAAPEGIATLQLQARHDGNGITIDSLLLRSAPGSAVELSIDGQGILPLHWSGTEVTPVATGTLVLHASARRASIGEAAPFAFEGTLRLDARSAALSQLGLELGPARLRGEATAEHGIASLFDPAVEWAAVPLQLALDVEQFDLATLPTSWLGAARLSGLVAGHVRAAGTVREPEPDVLLTLADGAVSGEGLPALTGAQLRLEVSSSDPAAKRILLATSASASLDPSLGLDQQVAFAAKVRCDDSGTALEPTVLKLGGGELAIELSSNLRRSDLLARTVDGARTTLAGKVRLREFDLAKLPSHLFGIEALRGLVSGELTLDGALGASPLAALHSAQLSLSSGELKVADLPRVEQLAVELTADRHEIALRSLTGELGAGRFTAQGSLQQQGTLLVEAFEDAALELRLDGADLMLYRGAGAKVRATAHLLASGTMRSVAVAGNVVLGRGTKYVRRISMLPALGSHEAAATSEGFDLPRLPPAIGDRISLDVALRTREPVEVRVNVVDADIDVTAHLRGKGSAPRLEGTMSTRRGKLRFPGANLTVDSALLTFTPREPRFPELVVNATGRRLGFVVTMSVTGRYDRPQVQLSSVPTLPPRDLIVLLTTGQLPSTLAERGAVGHARFVGGYLAQEVFEQYFGSESTERGESAFDRLKIESGREVSQNGVESVLIEYELVPRFSVQVERDAYEDYNLGLVLRFRFR
ncbi:MAG TPA: translocation/assembly module TamB domain-containing protein, partial [Planctomycetota bacterium]|nr:translocation/assembly module TamB domain-containing protein [Planctomycetota bacterium]